MFVDGGIRTGKYAHQRVVPSRKSFLRSRSRQYQHLQEHSGNNSDNNGNNNAVMLLSYSFPNLVVPDPKDNHAARTYASYISNGS